MSKLTKKYKAFTIHEMIVVLVIASLVITISILVLNLVQKQIQGITKGYQYKTEIRLLEKSLLNDLNTFELTYEPATNSLNGLSEVAEVHYKFFQNFILRNKDTLFIKIDEKQFFLDNIKVSSGTIDAIDIKIEDTFRQTQNTVSTHKLFLYKQKAAAFYMQQIWHSK